MKVIALDPSTFTGWVVFEYGVDGIKLLAYGEWNFPKKKGIDRVKAMADALYNILDKFEPDIAAIEGYGFANKHTLATLVEIGAVLRYTLHLYRLRFAEITPKSLKKFVTGNGNANKDKMMSACDWRWGFKGTDNEVDAYGLGMFVYAVAGYYTPSDKKCMVPVKTFIKEHKPIVQAIKLIESNCN